jgi:thioredoxin 1
MGKNRLFTLLAVFSFWAALAQAEIAWVNSYEDGLARAKSEGKPVLVDFTADWCAWCKVMDEKTFADPEIVKLAENFVCIRVDTDEDKKTAFAYKIKSLPRTLFLNVHGEIVGDHLGFLEPEVFLPLMQEVKEHALERVEGAANAPEIEAEQKAAAVESKLGSGASAEIAQNPQEVFALLGDRSPRIRLRMATMLMQNPVLGVPMLFQALESDYLGTRIAAFETLQKLGYKDLNFNPWAEKSERVGQLQAIRMAQKSDGN